MTEFTFLVDQFWSNSQFETFNYGKIHRAKISIFTKFTFSNSHFSQNSHLQNLIFYKIRNFKHQILGNFWIKSWFLPKCALKTSQKKNFSVIFAKSLIFWSAEFLGFLFCCCHKNDKWDQSLTLPTI